MSRKKARNTLIILDYQVRTGIFQLRTCKEPVFSKLESSGLLFKCFDKQLRGKPRGINRKNLSIYLPAVKNLIERRSKLRGIKPPLGDSKWISLPQGCGWSWVPWPLVGHVLKNALVRLASSRLVWLWNGFGAWEKDFERFPRIGLGSPLKYFQKCHTSLIFMADKRPWHPAIRYRSHKLSFIYRIIND